MGRSRRIAGVMAALVGCGGGPAGTTEATTGSGSSTSTTGTSGEAPTSSSTTVGATTGDGTTTWAVWEKFPERTFRGQLFDGAWLASDPCVLKDGAVYRMFYTCVAGLDVGGLCQVTSKDGVAWQPAPSIDPLIDGLVARARLGTGWDENMETCAVVHEGDAVSLYYSGYPALDDQQQRGPAALGRLTASDGVNFTRDPDTPILEATPGGRDGDDIFSAVVSLAGEVLEVVYVGWCIDGYHDGLDCAEGPAIQLLGATRTAGEWAKRDEPVLAPQAEVAWLQHGAAEPDVVRGPDGNYYLFMTGGLGDEPRVTGLAVGPTAFGPWELKPEPIVVQGASGEFDACGAFAPSVVIDGDRVRMWYLGIDDCDGACTSCDYAGCGCDARYTIGYAEAAWPLRDP